VPGGRPPETTGEAPADRDGEPTAGQQVDRHQRLRDLDRPPQERQQSGRPQHRGLGDRGARGQHRQGFDTWADQALFEQLQILPALHGERQVVETGAGLVERIGAALVMGAQDDGQAAGKGTVREARGVAADTAFFQVAPDSVALLTTLDLLARRTDVASDGS
jgi:hypothetical protein